MAQELVKKPKHFETFAKKRKQTKIDNLKTCYDANLYLKYQSTQLKELIKEESAKAKVTAMKSGRTGRNAYKPNDLLNEILRFKLDNQRYKEKIAALEHTMEQVKSS